MNCKRCGNVLTVTKGGRRYCYACQTQRQRKQRTGTQEDRPMSYQQIADELWMRGFPISKEWVRKLEQQALSKMLPELVRFVNQ